MLVDAVYAIVMTLLVLDLKLPDGLTPAEAIVRMHDLGPKVLAYVLGFIVTASGWAYVHHVSPLFARSNLAHVGVNLLALMLASLIPFSASVMGAFPGAAYGVQVFAINIGVLTAIYGVDLLIGRASLIPPVVNPRLVSPLIRNVFGAAAWYLVVGFVIAPLSPIAALAFLGIHAVAHWVLLATTEPAIRKATIEIEHWEAQHIQALTAVTPRGAATRPRERSVAGDLR
jgi:uncharacterized membrane protein